MTDLMRALAERLRQWDDTKEILTDEDCRDLASVVLAVVAERLPTREEIVKALSVEYGRLPDGNAYP